MGNFAVIRLGKDSVNEIRNLDALHESPAAPITFTIKCKQVPQELAAGDHAFFCFGSDNNQGAPTAWVRGVRALGTIAAKSGGPGYNDPWDVEVELKVVLPRTIARKDLLANAPEAYFWCSDIPIIGIDANSQQTVQLIKQQEPNQNVAALAYGLSTISPSFQTDTIKAYPELAGLFAYEPAPPNTHGRDEGEGSNLGDEWLKALAEQFCADTAPAKLRINTNTVNRFVAAILSKRFLIATGLAGSGKTKLAQAFARWMTPNVFAEDPFQPGTTLEGARKVYSITNSDRLGVEFKSDEGTKVLLPRAIIEQWADYIQEYGIPDTIGAQELRDQIKKAGGGEYSDSLQNFETHYKPAAFALMKARKNRPAAKCYEVIPVGADWTGSENIIGYPNGLDATTYITRPALELIRHALEPAFFEVPHFLILDEMNLSHVERYFADILSAIESEEKIPLYEGAERQIAGESVPTKLQLPKNLFIIGTVNVDETTYMFSPKVLDRANVIEFRMEPEELAAFLESPSAPRMEEIDSKGAIFGGNFIGAAADKTRGVPASVKADYEKEMLLFFTLLRTHNAEFGYRTGYEAARFVNFYKLIGGYSDDNNDWFKAAMDAVIVQKFLPRLHGSRSTLEGLLWALAWACGAERIDRYEKDFTTQLGEASEAQDEVKYSPEVVWTALREKNPTDPAKAAHYPLSFDKVMRMWRKLVRDHFVSFAEA